MHSAPVVSFPVGRSRLHGVMVVAIATFGVMLLAMWMIKVGAFQTQYLGLAAMLWLVSSSLAVCCWVKTPDGILAWDGRNWSWTSCGVSCLSAPEVALDFQESLLLRLHVQDAGDVWLWPERHSSPGRWLALRRALFAKTRAAKDHVTGLPASQDAAATPLS
jgi:hypothetical protein